MWDILSIVMYVPVMLTCMAAAGNGLLPVASNDTLATWNTFMCLYSAGMLYTWTIGTLTGSPHVVELSVYTYAWTKPVEFVDSMLLICRKSGRPPQFIHVYHHLLTSIMCAWAVRCVYRPGVVYAVMNMAVHVVMYMYFTISCYTKVSTTRRTMVTVMQVAQMIGGFIYSIYVYDPIEPVSAGFVVLYASFVVLFGKLLVC